MRGKVFIAWSGTRSVAEKVKKILDNDGYICSIGGNSDNNSLYSSVGDTIIQQIKNCNQAIVIFQNKQDGNVSNNVFFELGYVLARYGTRKIHCVKKREENIVLPSDFDSSFVEPVTSDGDEDVFARGIVDYFLKRQKMSIPEKKMTIIDNRYRIKEMLDNHYSPNGSLCSDYELAQYLIFYMQAAHMFDDEPRINKEIEKFHHEHHLEFSEELRCSVRMCLSFFKLVSKIKEYPESANVYIENDTFYEFKMSYDRIAHDLRLYDHDVNDCFSQWMRVYVYNHFSFVYMLIANNESLSMDERKKHHEMAIKFSHETLKSLKDLETAPGNDDNADELGLDSLIRAYIYRNLFVSNDFLGNKEEAKDWLKETHDERYNLMTNFEGCLDTQLQNTFAMEYHLAAIDYYCYMDPYQKEFNRNLMKAYLEEASKDKKKNSAYIRRIKLFYDKVKGE